MRAGGEEFELDCIVFATGFDAMTGSLLAHRHPRSRRRDRCATRGTPGPRTYLGLGVPGFPNLFIVTGPGSPSVLTNMVVSIEQHVELDRRLHRATSATNGHATHRGRRTTRPTSGSAYVNIVADLTLFPTCNSWYLGANIPGKPRVFMPLPGFPPYAEQCAHVAANGYRGFTIT